MNFHLSLWFGRGMSDCFGYLVISHFPSLVVGFLSFSFFFGFMREEVCRLCPLQYRTWPTFIQIVC